MTTPIYITWSPWRYGQCDDLKRYTGAPVYSPDDQGFLKLGLEFLIHLVCFSLEMLKSSVHDTVIFLSVVGCCCDVHCQHSTADLHRVFNLIRKGAIDHRFYRGNWQGSEMTVTIPALGGLPQPGSHSASISLRFGIHAVSKWLTPNQRRPKRKCVPSAKASRAQRPKLRELSWELGWEGWGGWEGRVRELRCREFESVAGWPIGHHHMYLYILSSSKIHLVHSFPWGDGSFIFLSQIDSSSINTSLLRSISLGQGACDRWINRENWRDLESLISFLWQVNVA